MRKRLCVTCVYNMCVMCACVCMNVMCVGVHVVQKRVSDPGAGVIGSDKPPATSPGN